LDSAILLISEGSFWTPEGGGVGGSRHPGTIRTAAYLERAGEGSTIVRTAKLNGANPETYLRDTLAKIANGHPINKIDELLPWRTAPQT